MTSSLYSLRNVYGGGPMTIIIDLQKGTYTVKCLVDNIYAYTTY